jgi:hypothetical protein
VYPIQRAFAILLVGVVWMSTARAQTDSDTTAPVQQHAPRKTTKSNHKQTQPADACYRGGQIYSNGYVDKWCAKYGPSGCVEMRCLPCSSGTWGPDQICR